MQELAVRTVLERDTATLSVVTVLRGVGQAFDLAGVSLVSNKVMS